MGEKQITDEEEENDDGNESSSSSSVDIDVDLSDDDEDEAFYLSGDPAGGDESALGKSPTQSIRSALSRPRSAPLRRATISGTSPSHYRAYINVTEVSED